MVLQDLLWHNTRRRRLFICVIIATTLLSPHSCLADSEVDSERRLDDVGCSCSGNRNSRYGQLHNSANVNEELTIPSTEEIETVHANSSGSTNHNNASPTNSSDDSNQLLKEDKMVYISGGLYFMGTNDPLIPSDGEGPRRLVNLSDFMIDRSVHTNLLCYLM